MFERKSRVVAQEGGVAGDPVPVQGTVPGTTELAGVPVAERQAVAPAAAVRPAAVAPVAAAPVAGAAVVEEEAVSSDPGLRLGRLIWAITAFIVAVIALRVVLHAVAASDSSQFMNFVNTVSGPFVTLFHGITSDYGFSNGGFLETSGIIAAVVWLIVGGLLATLARVVLGPSRSERRVVS